MTSTNTSVTAVNNTNKSGTLTFAANPPEGRNSLDSSVFTLFNKTEDLDTSKKSVYQKLLRRAQGFKTQHREFLAEFIGTTILVLLTCGFCAEQTLNIEQSKSWLTSSFGSGLSVLIGICVAGHVSGAHLNPAITISFSVFSGFPIRKVPIYLTAQLLGSFAGAALLYSIIEPAIIQFDQGQRQILGPYSTAGIFGTYPPLYVGTGSAIASEIVGTAMLLLIVMVTGHPNNLPFRTAQGAMIALGVTTISLCIGYTSGFSLNPARDFGPRLFTALAGWGFDVFRVYHYYALVPMFAPILGGLVGAFIYTVFID
ncbi:Aquaporin-3 [Rhizopus stolonifer]|uniref:Aquaporin-3 n=1 Tax=Rhizopus stolonifer TaxID=4846 RepID=A0A367J8H3_RHIST|nr:Aquaporin-3 [Rhizopus stolonifer]